MRRALGMCLEPRVLIGLATAGVLIWLVAPFLLASVLPLLLIAACPLSMLVMAWMMRGHMSGDSADPAARLVALEREQQRIANDIARTRATLAVPAPATPIAVRRDSGDTA